jgi:hypothetical protein
LTKLAFEYDPPLSRDGTLMGGVTENVGDASVDLLELWRKRRGSVYVNPTKSDGVECGTKSLPCRSLGYGAGQFDTTELMILVVEGNMHLQHASRLSSVEMRTPAEDVHAVVKTALHHRKDPALAIDQGGLVSVVGPVSIWSVDFRLSHQLPVPLLCSSSKLKIESASFASRQETAQLSLTACLVSVVGGSLQILDCSFSSIVSTFPVINWTTDSDPLSTPLTAINLTTSTFTNVTVSEAQPAILHLAGTACDVSLLNCHISNCSSALPSSALLLFADCPAVALHDCVLDGTS